MTWHAPPTFSPGPLAAASLQYLSDCLLETAPAKASPGTWPQHFVVSGNNTIDPRQIADHNVDTTDTTGSTEFTGALATTWGPHVDITTGSFALVFSNADITNSVSGATSRTGFDIVGPTGTNFSTTGRGMRVENTANYNIRGSATQLIGATPGANSFIMVYRVSSGTGTFALRRMTVMAL